MWISKIYNKLVNITELGNKLVNTSGERVGRGNIGEERKEGREGSRRYKLLGVR